MDPRPSPVQVTIGGTAGLLLAHLMRELHTDDGGGVLSRALGLFDLALRANQAQSDDRGEYRLFNLQPGAYYVRATPATNSLQASLAPVYYPGVIDSRDAALAVQVARAFRFGREPEPDRRGSERRRTPGRDRHGRDRRDQHPPAHAGVTS